MMVGDADTSNDLLGYNITTQPVFQVPYYAFTNSDQDEAWEGYLNSWISNGDTLTLSSPRVSNVSSDTYLKFDFTVSNSFFSSIVFGEKLAVQVSTDCGETFTTVYTIDVNNRGPIFEDPISLASYAGEEIIVRFMQTKVNSEGSFNASVSDVEIIDASEVIPSTPITAKTDVCDGSRTTFSTSLVADAIGYEWVIDPAEAGTVLGSGTVIDILWSDQFVGEANVSVMAINSNTDRSQPSDPLTITVFDCYVGMEDLSASAVNIYPNPASNYFNITIDEKIEAGMEVKIYNALGVLVQASYMEANSLEVNTSKFADGLYMVQLKSDGKIVKTARVTVAN
jgi:hypothetical protein